MHTQHTTHVMLNFPADYQSSQNHAKKDMHPTTTLSLPWCHNVTLLPAVCSRMSILHVSTITFL